MPRKRKAQTKPTAAAPKGERSRPHPLAKEEPAGYSQEQAAKKLGCSHSTINRAIARGAIEILSNGRIPESEISKLRAIWANDQKKSQASEDLERRLLAAQASEREAKAELAQLKVALESGRYVELEIVKRDGASTAERIVGVMRAIPQRVALALACGCRSGAVVESAIRVEIERAIGELGESMYVKGR